MNGVMKKLAALILAVAMITTFTPLYGAGAIAYAEDEEVAAQQDNAAAENEDPEGTEAGEENLAPAEGAEVTVTEGPEENVSSEEDGEEVIQGEENEEPETPEDGEEQPALRKAPQAGNLRNGEVEVTLSINKTTLEIMEEIPFDSVDTNLLIEKDLGVDWENAYRNREAINTAWTEKVTTK